MTNGETIGKESYSTPMRAIRAKCLDCCCGQMQEVRLCPSLSCALWRYRMGRNPARAGIGGKGKNAPNNNSSTDLSEQRGE